MSPLAKDFIDHLLVLDPLERYNAAQALKVMYDFNLAFHYLSTWCLYSVRNMTVGVLHWIEKFPQTTALSAVLLKFV